MLLQLHALAVQRSGAHTVHMPLSLSCTQFSGTKHIVLDICKQLVFHN